MDTQDLVVAAVCGLALAIALWKFIVSPLLDHFWGAEESEGASWKERRYTSREEVTAVIHDLFPAIKQVKRRGRGWGKFSNLTRGIALYGMDARELSTEELFATLAVLNWGIKTNKLRGTAFWMGKEKKDYLARVLVVWRLEDCDEPEFEDDGDYMGCWTISLDIWTTHIPDGLLRDGLLERRGRPSAMDALAKFRGRGFQRILKEAE